MIQALPTKLRNIGKSVYRVQNQMLDGFFKKNYFTARAYYHYSLARKDRRYGKSPVIVHQIGKVGSSTITKSLKNANIGRNIYHTHFLTPDLIEKYEEKRKSYLGSAREGDLKHIWQYQYLHKKIDHKMAGGKWKVITLIREPISRNMSEFFTHIEVLAVNGHQQWTIQSIEYDFELTIDKNLDPLIELFFERFQDDRFSEFFDREIKGVFNVDLFSTEFPTTKGYGIFQGDETDVLLIRLEDLDRCVHQAIEEFLGVQNIVMLNANVATQKEYAELYRAFKAAIIFPEEYVEKIYASRFMQHFYSEAEIENFRCKWDKSRVEV